MIQNEREIRHEHVLEAVRQMMTAARTAPKGKGIDIIEIAMVTGEDIQRLSDEMLKLAAETGFKFILRDAEYFECGGYRDIGYTPAGAGTELCSLRF